VAGGAAWGCPFHSLDLINRFLQHAMDPLSILTGLALSTVLEKIFDEASDAAIDGIKDSASERIKELLRRDPKKSVQRTLVAALLREIENELIGCGSTPTQIEDYKDPIVRILRKNTNWQLTARALSASRQPPIADAAKVASAWQASSLPPLPDDFSWVRVVRRYDVAADKICQSSEELRKLVEFDALAQLATTNKIEFGSSQLDTDSYAVHLKRRFDKLKLEVLDPQPLHTAISLQSVYVEPDLHASNYSELPSLEQGLQLDDDVAFRRSRVALGKAIEASSQRTTILLGHPGSGKSSTLAAYCLKWAALPNAQRLLNALPIHIDLRHFATCARSGPTFDFLDYLTGAVGIAWRFQAQELGPLLSLGKASLLFDGLDEVIDPEQRRNISTEICRLSAIYDKARFIVTSRIVGISSVAATFRDHSFSLFEIAPLSDAQIHSLVTRFHHAAYLGDPSEAQRATGLLGTLHSTPAIEKLARSPLLLTLLCLLSRHQDLPRDKLTLLERSSTLLLEQWDLSKSLPEEDDLKKIALTGQDKALILENVSSAMAVSGDTTIDERSLQRVVQETLERDRGYEDCRNVATKVVKQLRERNYVLCLFGGDVYGFVHRFFADYFLSRHIVARYSGLSEATRLDLPTLLRDYFVKFALTEFWYEPLQLVIRKLNSSDADAVLRALISAFESTQDIHYLWFAARCAGELSNPNKSKGALRTLEFKLRDIVEVPHQAFYNASPASSLDVQKFNYIQTQIRAVQALAQLPLLQSGGENWIRAQVSSRRNPLLRASALNAYCNRLGSSAPLESWLRAVADPDSGDRVPHVRMAVLRQLASRFAHESTADLLESFASDRSEHAEVKEVAIQELRRQWPARASGLDEV
jgi:hypothetical protein